MKQALIILLFTIISWQALAQDKLPAFLIVNTHGKYMRSSALPVHQSVLLIYFQPDCEDCREFTALLVKDDVIFRRYDLVLMITNSTPGGMRQFVKDFKLDDKKNIIVGTEGWTSSLQRKLNIIHFPFVSGYNKNKVHRWSLTNESDVHKLYDQLKRLSTQIKNDHHSTKTLP
jgi:hypothetical protein